MGAFSSIRARVIAAVEAAWAGTPSRKNSYARITYGDPALNTTVTIDGVDYRVGQGWTPKDDPEYEDAGGPAAMARFFGDYLHRQHYAASDPGPGDDIGDGFDRGSVWINTTSDEGFICTQSTLAAAVWAPMAGGSGGGGAPTNATYVVTSGSAGLSDEKVLGVDGIGLDRNVGASTVTIRTWFTDPGVVLGRKTAGPGLGEELTIDDLLDFFSTTIGAIPMRGGSFWSPLMPGTNRYLLTSNGAGLQPSYQSIAAAMELLGSSQGSLFTRGPGTWGVMTPGASGTVLTSQGPGADLIWAPAGGGTIDIITGTTGTLTVARGGTGATTDSGARANLGAAPNSASYVTMVTNGELTSERVLTQGTGITITDGGGGGPVTVATTVPPPQTTRYNPLGATWQTWIPPVGHTMVSIKVVGGGGGGGGGCTGAASTNRRGGGGGAPGGINLFIGPIVWSSLSLLVGVGGTGGGPGTPGVTGGSGGISYACVGPFTTDSHVVCKSSVTFGAGGGVGGGVATGGTGGTVGTAPGVGSRGTFAPHGAFDPASGSNGGNGIGDTSNTPNGTVNFNFPLHGGLGGGGVSSTNVERQGGSWLATAPFPALAGGAIPGGAGLNGVADSSGAGWLGGTGGAGNNTGPGGDGGDGPDGTGGGGGGGGLTGGTGGDGGGGWIEVTSW